MQTDSHEPIACRPAHPSDTEALIGLWTEANPGTNPDDWRAEWSHIPDAIERTFVAETSGGRLVSVCHYDLHEIRDAQGSPRRVGGVSRVATHPEFRRRGHAGRLLERAIAAMEQENCFWSLLDTSEEGRRLYERHGWSVFPIRYYQGGLTDSPDAAASHPYHIRHFDPDEESGGWERLAHVYDAYNAARPLTKVRSLSYWQGLFACGFRRWEGAFFLTASCRPDPKADLCGYVLAHIAGEGFLIAEAAALPGEEPALTALLVAVAEQARARGGRGGRFHLPGSEPHIDAALTRLLASVHTGEADTLMARPISPAVSRADITAIVNAPGAMFWLMDTAF